MTAIVDLEHVDVRRGGRTVLRNVSFSIACGERVAILGENGAGKSTLLRLIATVDVPDAGSVRRHGSVAWIPQEYRDSLFPWFSVLRNVAMPRTIARMTDASDVARHLCSSLLPRVDPSALAGRISGGEQQATSIARALAWPADLILADEPLSAIDAARKPAVRRALDEELRGRSLVLVTHDLVDATELCDRILRLDAGGLVAA